MQAGRVRSALTRIHPPGSPDPEPRGDGTALWVLSSQTGRRGLGTELELEWRRQCLGGAPKDEAESARGQTSVWSEGLARTRPGGRRGAYVESPVAPLGWHLQAGLPGWGWGGPGGHYELQPLAEVGPRKAVTGQQQGSTWCRSQVQRLGTHCVSQQAPWTRRLSRSLDLWISGQ